MKKPNIKLTDTQLKNINAVYAAIDVLAEDKDFLKKMEAAYNMVDAQINESNEDDYMALLNFKDNVIDITNCKFP
jgi:hypothetical protein